MEWFIINNFKNIDVDAFVMYRKRHINKGKYAGKNLNNDVSQTTWIVIIYHMAIVLHYNKYTYVPFKVKK